MPNFFKQGGGKLQAADPLQFFNKRFGGDLQRLLANLQGSGVSSQAFQLARRQAEQPLLAQERNLAQSLASRGQNTSGAGLRNLASIRGQRSQRIGDMATKINLGQQQQLASLLSSLAGASRAHFSRTPVQKSGFEQGRLAFLAANEGFSSFTGGGGVGGLMGG